MAVVGSCMRYAALPENVAEGRALNAVASCPGYTNGHAVFFMAIVLYCFLGLAIICDDFFVPALEKLSEVFHLSPDVAGATFMAAGSSAPELFTSAADTFGTENNIGMGTIVGSAMFNILVIVALAAAAADKPNMRIDWRPLTRDCVFYTLSILSLMWVFGDGVVTAFEGGMMVCGYIVYILFMTQNEKIFASRLCSPQNKYKVNPRDMAGTGETTNGDGTGETISDINGISSGGQEAPDRDVRWSAGKGDEAEGGDDGDDSPFAFPSDAPGRLWYIATLPFMVGFVLTVPDCSKKRWEKWYFVTFTMSIVWIAVLCAIMAYLATVAGCIGGIDPIIMGILVLAVGTSVPDAMGSMIVARQGEADMAIANAIGSNVFDILLGLGLPWMLKCLLYDTTVTVDKDGITESVIILLSTVLLFVLVIAVNGWMMSKKFGVTLFVMYLLYIAQTLAKAFGVF